MYICVFGGAGFHRNAFSQKRLFTERPFHQKGGYSSLGLFTEYGSVKMRFGEKPLHRVFMQLGFSSNTERTAR